MATARGVMLGEGLAAGRTSRPSGPSSESVRTKGCGGTCSTGVGGGDGKLSIVH